MQNIVKLEGHISELSYNPLFKRVPLETYCLNLFDINTSKSIGIIKVDDLDNIAFSKWVGPKRTRTYPLARVYNIYHHSGKKIAVIPIIKDEGAGTQNIDRINYITLSWLNLMNVYIILTWYNKAEKKSDTKITKQKYNNDYVREKLEHIKNFKLDAHHWNNKHFSKEFVYAARRSIESYDRISEYLGVKLHSKERNWKYLKEVVSDDDENMLDLLKFRNKTLTRSQKAAIREAKTSHRLELLSNESIKCILEITNYLGGVYYLTTDELFFTKAGNLIIQESKNTTKDKLPKDNDIRDGLFKLILFSNIDSLKLKGEEVNFMARLKITGDINGSILLPSEAKEIKRFLDQNDFSQENKATINSLNDEAKNNNIEIVVGE